MQTAAAFLKFIPGRQNLKGLAAAIDKAYRVFLKACDDGFLQIFLACIFFKTNLPDI